MADLGIDICEAVALRDTPRALLVRLGVPFWGKQQVWIPKSVIGKHSECRCWNFNPNAPGVKGMLIVDEWWAKKNGLHPHTDEARDKWDPNYFSDASSSSKE